MAEFETPSSLYWIYHASAFGFDFQRFRSHSERKGGKLSKYVSIPSSTVENLTFSLRGYSGGEILRFSTPRFDLLHAVSARYTVSPV